MGSDHVGYSVYTGCFDYCIGVADCTAGSVGFAGDCTGFVVADIGDCIAVVAELLAGCYQIVAGSSACHAGVGHQGHSGPFAAEKFAFSLLQ